MTTARKLAGRISALIFLSVTATQVFASGVGSITHSPDISGVPMLGGAGLVVLSALLGLVSLRFLKDRSRHGSTLVIAATLTGAIVAAGGGITLISEAQAMKGVLMSDAEGGTVVIPFDGYNTVINDTNVPQQIKRIAADEGCFIGDGELILNGGIPGKGNGGVKNGGNGGNFLGTCQDGGPNGTVLQPDDRCEVLVCCGPNGGDNGGNGGGGCFLL